MVFDDGCQMLSPVVSRDLEASSLVIFQLLMVGYGSKPVLGFLWRMIFLPPKKGRFWGSLGEEKFVINNHTTFFLRHCYFISVLFSFQREI